MSLGINCLGFIKQIYLIGDIAEIADILYNVFKQREAGDLPND